MKKLLLFMFAVVALAACEQAPIEEQVAVQHDAPESITVSFEGDDTRIQLNEAQKTVWTKGDQVSVFYKSDANQKYEYRGETGERTAELHKVSAGSSTTKMGYVVVAYPYSEEYIISPASGNLETMLPAVQHYAVDSYGIGDNLMVSCSEFTQFSLKNVCGWLKLQLTGNGEVVKGIKFRGNNGEQVAGLIHVDTKSVEATLYSEEVAPDDNGNANGSLVIDGAMATEVMLYCDEGVTLSSEATAFYIALPPQTFEEGFTVDVICTDGTLMAKSSDKRLSIERNHIQPMAAFEFAATGTTDVPTEPENPVNPNLPSNENNKIYYTTTDGKKMFPKEYDVATFSAILISNVYKDGVGVMTFDDDVTKIGNYAFSNCSSLTSVTIPDSVTTIGYHAFYYCTSLTSVTIGDSVTTIGYGPFFGCDSLTSVTIGDSVTVESVAEAFGDCRSLQEFKGKFASEDGRCLIDDGVLYRVAPGGLTEYTIPDSVTEVGDSAFAYCDSLTSVNIPDSVTSIGNYAFRSCDSLTSVNIPDSVTTIGDYAFGWCTSLTSVNIPDSVTTIGSAFYWCNSLTSITIPESVTTIGVAAFVGCNSLTEFNGKFAEDNGRILVVDGVLIAFAPAGITEYTIPDNVTAIEVGAFYWCDSLTNVTIPDSVTTIGDSAFGYCESLTSVYCKATTPPSLGYDVFYSNGSGRKIYVPAESVEAYKSAEVWSWDASDIVGYDFEKDEIVEMQYNNEIWYTSSDGNIVEPNNTNVFGANMISNEYNNGKGVITFNGAVTTIGNSAFSSCTSLTSVNIPDSVTTIKNSAFSGCTSLTSVTIPNSVTTIGVEAFYDCESLTSVNIPDSVTTIGYQAFRDCSSLTSVNIPDSVTKIEYGAFAYCTSLTSVYCKATTPPALGYDAFYYNGSGRKIYVPTESVETYKSATCWSEYANAIVGYDF